MLIDVFCTFHGAIAMYTWTSTDTIRLSLTSSYNSVEVLPLKTCGVLRFTLGGKSSI